MVTERLINIYLGLLKNVVLPALKKEAERKKLEAKKKFMKKKPKAKLGKATDEDLTPQVSRMAKIVIVGLNRALPFYKGTTDLVSELKEPINALMKSSSFATVMQAMNLYFLICSVGTLTTEGLNEAFSETVQKLLEKPEIVKESSAHPQLMALLYKILAPQELSIKATEKIIKSLLGLCFRIGSTAFVMASLLLLKEIMAHKPSLLSMINLPAEADFTNLSTAADSSLWELNVLSNHYDSAISSLARGLLRQENLDSPLPSNPFDCCSNLQFLKELTSKSVVLG